MSQAPPRAKTPAKPKPEKVIATHPTVFSDYFIDEMVEAGIVLTGTEAKSLRTLSPNLRDSYVDVVSQGKGHLEAWLFNLHIAPYSHGNIWNHITNRKRKLLLHRHQIEKIYGSSTKGGMTIIPIRMYFKTGRVKLELGIGKGKKKFDKRETLKKKSAERDMEIARKHDR